MDWTVRRATPAAAPTIRDIARESWHAAYDAFLGAAQVDRMIDEWYALEALERSIDETNEGEGASFLVAVPHVEGASDADDAGPDEANRGRDAVGFAHAGVHPEDPSIAYLSRLYARPRVWGEGVGTALLERVESDLQSGSACDRLRLTVLADNEIGISFYESSGFERVETRLSDLDGIDGAGQLEEYSYEKPL